MHLGGTWRNWMARLEEILTAAAHEQGFVLVGFAPLRRLDGREEFFNRWLADGRQGEMGWLGRDPERRLDPRRIDTHLRSVVSLGYPYAAPAIPNIDWRSAMRGRIAAYALGPDYHDTVLARARAVAARLKSERPDAVTRAYVDTGAVFEREWAGRGAHRMVRQEHQPAQPSSRVVFFSRRDFHRRRIRAERRALSRALRHVPPMPRSLSDRRAG